MKYPALQLDDKVRLQIELDVWTLIIQMAIHGAHIWDERIHGLVASWSKMGFGTKLDIPNNSAAEPVDEVVLAVEQWNAKLTVVQNPDENSHGSGQDSPMSGGGIPSNLDGLNTIPPNADQLDSQSAPPSNADRHQDGDEGTDHRRDMEESDDEDGNSNMDKDGDVNMASVQHNLRGA